MATTVARVLRQFGAQYLTQVLAVPYAHMVFTLPHGLKLAPARQALCLPMANAHAWEWQRNSSSGWPRWTPPSVRVVRREGCGWR